MNSFSKIFNILLTPYSPSIIILYNTGLPINTHLAPNCRHLNTSVPPLTPPSTYISIESPTALTTSGNISIVALTVSNCLPPWLLTHIASTPYYFAKIASSALWIPFKTIGSFVIPLSHDTSFHVKL